MEASPEVALGYVKVTGSEVIGCSVWLIANCYLPIADSEGQKEPGHPVLCQDLAQLCQIFLSDFSCCW